MNTSYLGKSCIMMDPKFNGSGNTLNPHDPVPEGKESCKSHLLFFVFLAALHNW